MSTFGRPTLVCITDCSTAETTTQGRPYIRIDGQRVAEPAELFAQRFYGSMHEDLPERVRLLQSMMKRALYVPFGVPWPPRATNFNPRVFIHQHAFMQAEGSPLKPTWRFFARQLTENACRGCMKANARAGEDGLCFKCYLEWAGWAGAREEQFTEVRGNYLIALPVAVDQWMEERAVKAGPAEPGRATMNPSMPWSDS